MRELDQAEECAVAAIDYTPNAYQPFNLLGGIYYSRGLPEEGDDYFREAVKRGALEETAEATIRSVFKTSGPDVQRRVAAHLWNKNQAKYRWAKKYL
jgi:hypothetical protein